MPNQTNANNRATEQLEEAIQLLGSVRKELRASANKNVGRAQTEAKRPQMSDEEFTKLLVQRSGAAGIPLKELGLIFEKLGSNIQRKTISSYLTRASTGDHPEITRLPQPGRWVWVEAYRERFPNCFIDLNRCIHPGEEK